MTPSEMLMTAVLLDQQSLASSRKGCNDLDSAVLQVLSEPEWIALCERFHHYNGDPEHFDPHRSNLPYDFVWLAWSAIRLVEHAMMLEPAMVLTHPSSEVRRLVKKVRLLQERTKHLQGERNEA
jgi:hypothetical protein